MPIVGVGPGFLRSQRLILRRWRDEDRAPFARLNADPIVMEHMIAPLTREQSDAFIDRAEAAFEQRGFGLWAVEVADGSPFIGFVGLSVPRFDAPFMPAVEIGWRLDRPYWGRGYASEAARTALADGFARIGLAEIVAMTIPANLRSIRVMEKLGMTRDPADDFEHPLVAEGHHARHHVLYRIKAP